MIPSDADRFGIPQPLNDGQHFLVGKIFAMIFQFVLLDRSSQFGSRLGQACVTISELSVSPFGFRIAASPATVRQSDSPGLLGSDTSHRNRGEVGGFHVFRNNFSGRIFKRFETAEK